MMQKFLHAVRSAFLRKSLTAGTMLAGMAGLPTAAFAHHGFHIDVAVPFPPPICVPAVVVPPSCDASRVWVGPVYQTVNDRTWVPPTTTSEIVKVYVPGEYGFQDVESIDGWGRRAIYRQRVLITPAHYEDRQQDCVQVPGHWQDVQRQELVSPGHWELQPPPAPVVSPFRLEFRLPF